MRHLLLASLLLPPGAGAFAAAELWRCVDARGHITWSDLGCKGPRTVHAPPHPVGEGLAPLDGDALDPADRERLRELSGRRGGHAVRTRPATTSLACEQARVALAQAMARRRAHTASGAAASERRRLRAERSAACR